MSESTGDTLVTLSISAVERDTGISKDTLRVWERRYGYPNPARDRFGERAYTMCQVDKLRVMRRLLDQGHRPGRIIEMPINDLLQLAEQAGTARQSAKASPACDALFDGFLTQIRSHQIENFRRDLAQSVLRNGIDRFVTQVAAPLNEKIGEAWARGSFAVFEEHLYTESMQVVLRNAISGIPAAMREPRILLTTFPGEAHGLGLLMAEALMTLDGCRCFSLGPQTPIRDIAEAAKSQKPDVVALSFTASLKQVQIINGLSELRAALPDDIEIWCGGQCVVLQRKPIPGIRVMQELAQIGPAIADWRARHGVDVGSGSAHE